MNLVVNLKTFLEVVRQGNFSDAARELHVVPSVVAKRIEQLEHESSARLFNRTTRKVALTSAGEALNARAAVLLAELDEVLGQIRSEETKVAGHIKVMAPSTLTFFRLGPIFTAFMAKYPNVTLEISLVERSINPAQAGYDVAITGHGATFEGVVDVPLCPVDSILCAAPAYLKAQGMPKHPRELVQHPCLVFAPAGNTWAFEDESGAIQVDVPARLATDDNHTLLLSALSAQGITLLPAYLAQPAITRGELTPVLRPFMPASRWFKAYVPRRRHQLPRVRALLQFLAEQMALDAASDHLPVQAAVKPARPARGKAHIAAAKTRNASTPARKPTRRKNDHT